MSESTTIWFDDLGDCLRIGISFAVNCRDCTEMDSTALGILVGAVMKIREARPESKLRIVNPRGNVLESIKRLGLQRLFVFDGEEEEEEEEDDDDGEGGVLPSPRPVDGSGPTAVSGKKAYPPSE